MNESEKQRQVKTADPLDASVFMKVNSSVVPLNKDNGANGETRLIKYINGAYRRWAYCIADHSTFAIIISIIVSVICTIKVVRTPYTNDMTGYVPYGARSRDEFAVQEEFANYNGRGVLLMAVILAKDNGSVLTKDILEETLEINNIISTNFTIMNHFTGKAESFNEFCRSFCLMNAPIEQFYNGFEVQLERLVEHQPLHDRIQLRYPVSHIYGHALNVQMNFIGVILSNETNTGSDVNETLIEADDYAPLITNMDYVKMINLMYRGERVGDWTDQETKTWEMAVVRYFENEYEPKHVRILVVSYEYVDVEITRAGLSMLPYLIVGFAIMSFCSTLSTMLSAAYMQQVTFHKVYLAVFACICPFMANATAIGILLTFGMRYGSILCVTPFLVLAIGVDDSYLMIHAWQRVVRECRAHPTKDDCVAYRLAEVLTETGPAILISALTNILADGVGAFTGSPEITLLCFGNMSSIFMDYIYQLTFYSAIICIAGQYEMRAESEANKHSIEIDGRRVKMTSCCGQTPCEFRGHMKGGCTAFLDGYVKLVSNGFFAFFVVCLWIAFIAVSILGITQLKIELTPEKLFSQDSPLLETDNLLQEYKIPQYTMAQFYVDNPGNLSDPSRLEHLNHLVYELEHLEQSWGASGSNYFIRDFLEYKKFVTEMGDFVNDSDHSNALSLGEDDIVGFLSWPEYDKWRGFIILNETKKMVKFFFTTAYHGEELKEWPSRGALLNSLREIIDKYKEFNVTVFMDDGIYLDLIDNMPTDAWQSALGTLLCMAFICFIFLYDAFTVIVVSAAILSIMTGIMGMANFMGLYLDPIMMAAMLIAMGFSVDIPAHVTYHYNSAGVGMDRKLSIREKLRVCFASVALPALQASTSTNLCVLGLLFIPLYMAQVFVRMMVLCISLCVLHGLLIIPSIFVVIDIAAQCLSRRRKSVVSSSES